MKNYYIIEYRKLNDFRYSALGFGEFCEIHPRQARDSEAQGVIVTQQASGLLRNARPKVPYRVAVKPPMLLSPEPKGSRVKISASALIFFIIFLLLPLVIYADNQIILYTSINTPSYSSINEKIKTISDGNGFEKGEIGLSLCYFKNLSFIKLSFIDLSSARAGIGFNYSFGQIVDTSLTGINGNQIKTGSIEVSWFDILLPIEYSFLKGSLEAGAGLTPMYSIISLNQNINEESNSQSKYEMGIGISIYGQLHYTELILVKLKAQYNILHEDKSGGINMKLGVGIKFK